MMREKYYYDRLSVEEQFAYKKLYESILKLENVVDIKCNISGNNSIEKIIRAIVLDNPLLYFVDISNIKTGIMKEGVRFVLSYFCDQAKIKKYNEKINSAVNSFVIKVMQNCKTDYEKELFIHDYFCENVQYDFETLEMQNGIQFLESHSIIGVIKKKKALCDGIAKTIKVLFNACDIPCIIVTGDADSDYTKRQHAWNVVRIGGISYHLDVTFDLGNSNEIIHCYDYFNLYDKQILKDHYNFSDTPQCVENKDNYYKKNKYVITSKDELEGLIKTQIKKRKNVIYFKNENKLENIENLMHFSKEYVFNLIYEIEGNSNFLIRCNFNDRQNTGTIWIEYKR